MDLSSPEHAPAPPATDAPAPAQPPAAGPHPPPSPGGGAWWCAGVLAFAAGLGAYHIAVSPAVARDGVVFLRFATRLDQALQAPDARALRVLDVVRSEDQHPLYPAAILLAVKLGGKHLSEDPVLAWERTARLVCFAGHLLFLWGVFLVGRRLFDPLHGAVAAAVLAGLPEFSHTGVDALSDPPSLALMMFALLFAVRAVQPGGGFGDVLASAIFSGLGYACRPEYAQIAVVLAAALGLRFLFGWGTGGRRAAFVAGLALVHVVAAYAVPLMALRGSILTKAKWEAVMAAARAEPPAGAPARPRPPAVGRPPAAVPPEAGRKAPPAVGALPGARTDAPDVPRPEPLQPGPSAVMKILPGIREFFSQWFHNFRYGFGVLALIGLAAAVPGFRSRPERLLLVGAAAVQFAYLVFGLYFLHGYMAARHLMPSTVVAAFFVLPGAMAAGSAAGWLLRRFDAAGRLGSADAAPVRVAAALTVVLWLVGAVRAAGTPNRDKTGYRAAGAWLAEGGRFEWYNMLLDPLAISGWYAGLDYANLWRVRDQPLTDEYLAMLMAEGLRVGRPLGYLVMDDRYRRQFRPGGMERAPGMRFIEVADFPADGSPDDTNRVRVYKITAVPEELE